MKTNPRLFIAVPVRLYDYPRLRRDFGALLQGRWREEGSLHVTLSFLGRRIRPEEAIARLGAFEWSFLPSELGGLDYFSRSRVFVATTENPTLQPLYERLAPLLELPNALLRPHVTLMRVKGFTDEEGFFNRLRRPVTQPLGVLEKKIVLYRSDLHPEGASYTPLKMWEI